MERETGYVDAGYLVAAGELAAPLKMRSYALLDLRPGQWALDVGCGPGIDTVAMAGKVAPGGRVCGVDADPDMIAAADAGATAAGVGDHVEHRVGSVERLPYADGAFSAVRSERLLEHLANPAAALAEMVRVTAPGGRIVVVDPDWGTLSLASEHTDLERRLTRRCADRLTNGYSGRRLFGMFRDAGLTSVQPEARSVVLTDARLARFITRLDEAEADALRREIVTQEELSRWREEQASLGERGGFFGSLTVVTVVGQRPQ